MSNKNESIGEMLLSNPYYHKDMMEDEETSILLASDNLVSFIVGGTKFQTAKSNFAFWPKTRLSRLIRAKTEEEKLRLCDKYIVCEERKIMETYVFFRSGKSFDAVLDKSRQSSNNIEHVCFNFKIFYN